MATIDPAIDLQATEVHCQAFPGFVLQEISKNITQIHNLKDALDKFCPRYFQSKLFFCKFINIKNIVIIINKILYNTIIFRIDSCPEVQVVNLKSRCAVDVLDCPTIYATENV